MHVAAAYRLQADQSLDERRFPAARFTHHAQGPAFGNSYTDIIYGFDKFLLTHTEQAGDRVGLLGIVDFEMFKLEQIFIGIFSLCGGCFDFVFFSGFFAALNFQGVDTAGQVAIGPP